MNNQEKQNDMKRFLVLILAMIPVCGMMAQSSQESKMNKFVDNLMSKMTIEEKIGQLNMPSFAESSGCEENQGSSAVGFGA